MNQQHNQGFEPHFDDRAGVRVAGRLILMAGLLLWLTAAMFLILGIPTVQAIPGWFLKIRYTAIGPAWPVVLVLGVTAWALWVTRVASPRARPAQLAALVGLGVLIQFGLAFSEGRGIDALRERTTQVGHAEFAQTATRGYQPYDILTGYEELVAKPSQRFSPSKPPGQLLVYMGMARIAGQVMPSGRQQTDPIPYVLDDAHRQLVDLLTLSLPVFAALAILPIAALGRFLLPMTSYTLWPAALFASSAALALNTLCLDQALYPLLACLAWLCAALAAASSRRTWAWSLALGMITWLATFISFSLVVIVPIACVVAAITALHQAPGQIVRKLVQIFLWAGVGLAAPTAALWIIYGYDPIARFEAAMAYHAAWKHWQPGLSKTLSSAILNLVEFSYWTGPHLVGMLLWGAVAGPYQYWRKRDPRDLLAAGLVLIVLVLSLTGKTMGEVARLWLFILPMVMLAAMSWILRAAGPRWAHPLLVLLLLMQLGWCILLKCFQDVGPWFSQTT